MRISVAGRTALAAALLVALSACAPTAYPLAAPTTRPAEPDPVLGAVFAGGGPLHTCSATVLKSAAGNLILTAAHCLAGGVEATFVPGFRDVVADGDVWDIDAVYLDERWVTTQDPRADFAIARVRRDAGGSVEAQSGRGLVLGRAPKPGAVVTVTGYAMGVGGGPVSCTGTTAQDTRGYPSLPCLGLADGLSGAPWLDGKTVTGIVGGLNGGGCDEKISYSPPFDDAVARLLTRAEAGGPADDPPAVFDDGCD